MCFASFLAAAGKHLKIGLAACERIKSFTVGSLCRTRVPLFFTRLAPIEFFRDTESAALVLFSH